MSEDVDKFFDDDVSTGATLQSGTTIGSGNEIYHLGNDGVGSGLDTETVRGKNAVPTNKNVEREKIFESTGNAGNVLTEFSSPSASAKGVGIDSNDCIWHAVLTSEKIFQLDQTGTQISQFNSPSGLPSGVSVDKDDCIWHSDFAADSIFEISQNGDFIGAQNKRLSSPSTNPRGVGLTSNGCIWHTDQTAESLYKLVQPGLETASNPVYKESLGFIRNPRGMGVNVENSIWQGGTGSLYKFDELGNLLTQFSTPDGINPDGVGPDSNDNLWISDTGSDKIYQVDSGQKFNGKQLREK